MLSNVPSEPGTLEPRSIEAIADTLFEIGRAQAQKLCWTDALYWFERAYDAITNQTLEALSTDAEELRMSIMHGMARAMIKQDNPEGRVKAWDLIHKIEVECGERLMVLLLKLDLLTVDPAHSPQDQCGVLQKVIRTVHLTDTIIKTILHHVHRLRARSPSMAHTVLVVLLSERLSSAEQPQWLEKALVTAIWNCTTSTSISNVLGSLGELFETLATNSNQVLSRSATHAAQTVRVS